MSAKVRRVDFSADEWLAGTVELSAVDRGVYITICALIYSRGGPIDIELVRAHCRQDHGNVVIASIERLRKFGKIVRNGSEIGQKRSEKELENARIRSQIASENVSKRWKNKALEPQSVLPGGKANHQPSTINHQLEDISLNRDSRPPRKIAEEMVEIWHELVCPPLARVAKITDKRSLTATRRLDDCFHGSLDEWRAFLAKVRASPHLTGANDRGWRADFDFCTREDKILNTIEGRYDAKPNGAGAGRHANVSERRKPDSPAPKVTGDFWRQGGE